MKNIIVFIRYPTNTGYAISSLEEAFFAAAKEFAGDLSAVHFAYTSLTSGRPRSLPNEFENIVEFDITEHSTDRLRYIENYVREQRIEIAIGLDCPVRLPAYRHLRHGGVKRIISYYGAPMSDLNSGVKLMAKRLQVFATPYKPDLYIFESKAMQLTAVQGRGISKKKTTIVHLGVDTKKFFPSYGTLYACEQFAIPGDRMIVFYSGHMQERKGVHVLVKAAAELVNRRQRRDLHFLFLGNKDGEEAVFDQIYKGTKAEQFITFGGYRNDVDRILPGCHLGVIASTGWDSFTMSSIEMAAAGLPLVVSNLQGLAETIVDGKSGFLFEVGNVAALADRIEMLADDERVRDEFGVFARKRAVRLFSKEAQRKSLVSAIRSVV